MKTRNITIIFIILVIAVVVIWYGFFHKKEEAIVVNSFEECVNANYPVMESYPRQCKTPDGRTYTEEIMPEITYYNASSDLVAVDLPYPGAVTGKTFKVMGNARGTWYFEASFPVEVLDKDGNSIFMGHAEAQSDWMTEDFVPFIADVTIPDSYTGSATLILHKDNPSGLPEKEASVAFPITIEY